MLLEGQKQPKSNTGRNLASIADEMTIQHWCFQRILAPVAQYRNTHYPSARYPDSSMPGISD